jgi:hypothetical protein
VAFNILKRYVPTNDSMYELKMHHGWSDVDCFNFLVKCVEKCKFNFW